MLATDTGLYELSMQAVLTPVAVESSTIGFYAIAIASDIRGQSTKVAVAAQNSAGVFLSNKAGKSNTFKNIGQKNLMM